MLGLNNAVRRALKIRQTVPRLRQFGQMLIGSLQLTDQITLGCLEQLAQDWHKLNQSSDEVVSLYQNFLEMLGSQDFILNPNDILGELPPCARRVFLLLNVQEFQEGEVATIMRISLTQLDQIKRQIATILDKRSPRSTAHDSATSDAQLAH